MKWILPAVLILSIGLAILFRVVLPFGNVFNDGVQLNTPDGYLMVRYADCWPDIPKYDYFLDYFEGSRVTITVWPTVIAIVARLTGLTNMESAAVLPPLLFLLTLIPVYVIGRTLFNKWTAVGAVAIFCLLPGDLLNRTMLGAADYHAWEIFLAANVMSLVILAIYNYKDVVHCVAYSVSAVVLWLVYWASWPGALWLVFVLGIAFAVWLYVTTKRRVLWILYTAVLVWIAGMVFYFMPVKAMFYLNEMIKMFSLNLGATVTEEMSLFFSFGKFDLNTSWLYFGVTLYFALIGLGWMVYRYVKERKAVDLVFLIWTLVSLAMMICRRRYDYYFAINAAIVASFVMVAVAQYLSISKANKIKIAVVVLMAVCLPLIRADVYISTADTYMSQGWRDATQFLRAEKEKYDMKQYPYTMKIMGVEVFNWVSYNVERLDSYYTGDKYNYGVFSWWDYGYWIIEESHLPTYCEGSERDLEGSILVATDPERALASLRTLKMRYVVVGQEMLTTKWYPISKGKIAPALEMSVTYGTSLPWGTVRQEDTLVYKLVNAEEVQGFKRVFLSENVTVYEVMK
jgi:asparagine N-glycosylation enzyme membrane subunit Stt3